MKQQSKLFKVTVVLWTLTALISFNSCKKNPTSPELSDLAKIENAKNWYINDQTNINSIIRSNKGDSIKLKINPQWELAKVENIDEKSVVITKIQTNIQKLFGNTTQLVLIIVSDGNNYYSKIVSVKNSTKNVNLSVKDLYESAFTDVNISKNNNLESEIRIYSGNFKDDKVIQYNKEGRTSINLKQSLNSKSNIGFPREKLAIGAKDINKLSVVAGCVEYVLCVSIYVDGVLIDYFETSLGRYCPASDDPQDPDWSGDTPNTRNTIEEVSINLENLMKRIFHNRLKQ